MRCLLENSELQNESKLNNKIQIKKITVSRKDMNKQYINNIY